MQTCTAEHRALWLASWRPHFFSPSPSLPTPTPHSAVDLDTVTNVNPSRDQNFCLGCNHVVIAAQLLTESNLHNCPDDFCSTQEPLHLLFSLSPSSPFVFCCFRPSLGVLARVPGVTVGGWGAMVLTSNRRGKAAELPQDSATLLSCCWFTLCHHCFAQWHEEQLAIQEGQDSFHNSECADDGGYVNNENKSSSFFLSKKCMKCMWPVAKMASFHIWPTPAAGNVKPYAGLKYLCSCLVQGILDYGRLDGTLPAVTPPT